MADGVGISESCKRSEFVLGFRNLCVFVNLATCDLIYLIRLSREEYMQNVHCS